MDRPKLKHNNLSEEDVADLAIDLGALLRAGDVVLLEGPVGAGKTFFARALIQSLLDVPEDVPSPTFTLVQIYDTTAGELWHGDLYRLTTADEIEELGLLDAFRNGITLLEWPDRLGHYRPENALEIEFVPGKVHNKRTLLYAWQDASWTERLGISCYG